MVGFLRIDMKDTNDLAPGMKVKTRGNQIVEVFSVRHFNDTVSIGHSRKFPVIVSVEEIAEIIEE